MAVKTANSEAAPRWREASDTLPLNRESDHTGTSEYRIAKFSVIGEEWVYTGSLVLQKRWVCI